MKTLYLIMISMFFACSFPDIKILNCSNEQTLSLRNKKDSSYVKFCIDTSYRELPVGIERWHADDSKKFIKNNIIVFKLDDVENAKIDDSYIFESSKMASSQIGLYGGNGIIDKEIYTNFGNNKGCYFSAKCNSKFILSYCTLNAINKIRVLVSMSGQNLDKQDSLDFYNTLSTIEFYSHSK